MTLRERLLGQPGCLIIAEVGQAHDGSLGTAHAFIDAIAGAGADAVKFQTHIAEAESTSAEPWRVRFSPQDATRFEYWRRMELTADQWAGLRQHADEVGLLFLSSPFSSQAVALLSEVGLAAWKVASGEITNLPLLDHIVAAGGPVILSSGMSPYADLDRAVAKVVHAGRPLAVLQCTSAYPCPPEKVGLNVVTELRERYPRADVGLSDHSGTIWPAIAGAARGIDVLELHVTLSRHAFGPDVPASVTVEELAAITEGVRFVEVMRANPVDKEAEADRLAEMRAMFGKSVVAVRDLDAGHVLTVGDLALKKPGTGIPAADADLLIGRALARAVTRDDQLTAEMVEERR